VDISAPVTADFALFRIASHEQSEKQSIAINRIEIILFIKHYPFIFTYQLYHPNIALSI